MFRFWVLAACLAALGVAMHQPWLIAVACVLTGAARVITDLLRREGFGAATLWGGSMAMAGVADLVGLLVTDPGTRGRFYLYAVDEYLVEAMLITFLGGSSILVGFALANRRGYLSDSLPPVTSGGSSRAVRALLLAAGVLILVMRANAVEMGSGTASHIYYIAVPLIVFAQARDASRRNSNFWLWAAAVLAYGDAIRAALFEYLRGQIILPMVALVLGCMFGARGLGPLRRLQLLPMYAFLIVFVMFFETFATERADIGLGFGRVQELTFRHESSDAGAVTLLARLTSFNQVSQVVRLTRDDGFEYGQTLAYFGYVFIPRFLWPDKPLIAQGQWFAERLGLGAMRTETGVSNAINMTIAGELYLNFGWLGPVLGGVVAGLWMGLLWNAARFWSLESDPVGGMYAFFMLSLTWGLSTDIQILPTAIAVYLLFWALARAVRGSQNVSAGISRQRQAAVRMPRVALWNVRGPRR
jgi:hypothetical protein